MTERLTTLAAVKEWLDITTDEADAGLIRLINAASQYALDYMGRDTFALTTYTQNGKGNGKSSMLLRNWPVVGVTSMGVQGTAIGAAVIGASGLPGVGYVISDPRNAQQALELFGHSFYYGAYVSITYQAGYSTTQDVTIAASNSEPTDNYCHVTPTNAGQWISDIGVTIDDVSATRSTAPTPAAGEYYVSEWGEYTFNIADLDKDAVISYSFVPWSVSQAVCELIGEWYKRKDRIGLLSKTLGGQETVTFSSKDMNDTIRAAFQFYANVVPV